MGDEKIARLLMMITAYYSMRFLLMSPCKPQKVHMHIKKEKIAAFVL
jgi:hypothetical protein